MTRKEIEQILKKNLDYVRTEFHVSKIGLFGSYVREEQTNASDIDILVEFSRPVGFEFFDLKDYLEGQLGKRVDLVTINALKPQIKDEILDEVQFQ